MLPVASGGAWHTAAFLSINTFIYFQIVCRAAATWYIRCAPLNQIEQMSLKDFFFFELLYHSNCTVTVRQKKKRVLLNFVLTEGCSLAHALFAQNSLW